jgi:hypothetical protein
MISAFVSVALLAAAIAMQRSTTELSAGTAASREGEGQFGRQSVCDISSVTVRFRND